MIVSSDAPACDIAYKPCEYAGTGRMKLPAGKRNLPGRKQVFRRFVDGEATADAIARHSDPPGPAATRMRNVEREAYCRLAFVVRDPVENRRTHCRIAATSAKA
jgi:hypothetical protein